MKRVSLALVFTFVGLGFAFELQLHSALGAFGPLEEFPAEYRGYAALNQTLKERLFKEPSSFDLSSYIGSSGLAALLGVFNGDGLSSGFQNGKPNAINTLLLYMAFTLLSEDLSKICSESSEATAPSRMAPVAPPPPLKFPINDTFRASLVPICKWPALEARSDPTLLGLWLTTMGYEAPEDEFEAWKKFFQGPGFQWTPADEVIKSMLTAVFFNPHFLLQQ